MTEWWAGWGGYMIDRYSWEIEEKYSRDLFKRWGWPKKFGFPKWSSSRGEGGNTTPQNI